MRFFSFILSITLLGCAKKNHELPHGGATSGNGTSGTADVDDDNDPTKLDASKVENPINLIPEKQQNSSRTDDRMIEIKQHVNSVTETRPAPAKPFTLTVKAFGKSVTLTDSDSIAYKVSVPGIPHTQYFIRGPGDHWTNSYEIKYDREPLPSVGNEILIEKLSSDPRTQDPTLQYTLI